MDKEILIEPLGNIFKTTSGGTPSRKKPEFYLGNIPWVKSGELENNIIYGTEEKITEDAIKNSSAKIFPAGTLLIALYGATIGKLAFLGIKATTNQAVCGIFDNGVILSKYTYYFLLFRRPKLIQSGMGGAQPNISQDIVRKQPFPIIPFPKQRAIVSKIEQLFSDLDNGIENFKKAQEQLKRYRQSVLKAACGGKLVSTEAELARAEGGDYEPADVLLTRILKERREKWNGKGKYKEPVAPDTSGVSGLSEGWGWARFEQIVSLSQNGFGKRSSKDGNPTIVLRLADILNGEISLDNVRRIGATIGEIEKYRLFNNDILCIRVNGSRKLVGRMIRYKPMPEPITFCDHFIRFQLIDPTMAPFFSIYFDTDRVRKYIDINTVSSAGQNTVSQATIMAIPIPLPPLAEQHRIVVEVERRLSVCDKMEATIAESLEKAESLRQSILKKAFEGKLLSEKELEGVRNAPDWEPAEKLLERIKAEKNN